MELTFSTTLPVMATFPSNLLLGVDPTAGQPDPLADLDLPHVQVYDQGAVKRALDSMVIQVRGLFLTWRIMTDLTNAVRRS